MFLKLAAKYLELLIKERINIIYSLIGVKIPKGNFEFFGGDLQAEEKIKLTPDEYIYLGEFEPKIVKNSAIRIMEIYVAIFDLLIKKAPNEKIRKSFINKQFITFDDFLKCFEKPEKLEGTKTREQYSVKEGRNVPKYSYYQYDKKDLQLPFKYFSDRTDFIREYSKDEKGYCKLLHDSKLTKFFDKKLPYILLEKERKMHTFIIAGSGSGKSEFIKFLIYSTITRHKNKAVILIEPHGDLSKQVAQFKYFSEYPERLVYIDFNIDSKCVPVINPFHLEEKTAKNIQTLTDSLIKTFEALLKNCFTPRMKTMLTYCLPALIRRKNSTLEDLKRFVTIGENANNQDLIDFALNSPNKTHREYFRNDFSDNKSLRQTKDGLRDRLSSLLASPVFARATTGRKSLDLEQYLNQGKVVVCNLSKGVLGTESGQAFGTLIVGILLYIAYKREEIPEHLRPENHLFIDEFQNYVLNDPKQFENILSETRKYGLHLTIANQYARQLGNMGLKEAIEENTRVRIRGFSQKDDELKNLEVGKFYVTCGGKNTIKLQVPDFLIGNNYSMSKEAWNLTKQYQLEKYYQCYKPKKMQEGPNNEPIENQEDQIYNVNKGEKNSKFGGFKSNLSSDIGLD